jgi:RNA polymerase sigma-70 factor, ECF subfamily
MGVGDRVRPPGEEGDWERMRAAAIREARRFSLATEDVDDAVQEAMVRAWRQRDACRAEDRLPWMRQIARNESLRLIDRRRRRGEREMLDDETILGALVDLDAEDERDEMLLRLAVGKVLDHLSIEDRRLVALRYEEDLSQPDVARALGIPEGTVKVRLHRIRGRLRKALDATQ